MIGIVLQELNTYLYQSLIAFLICFYNFVRYIYLDIWHLNLSKYDIASHN